MVSSKELRYVNSWASKIPMPGVEYSSEVMNSIRECYEIYNKKYKDKQYSIIFSNGEEIDFEIMTKNLCHMLGIDYDNIKGDYFDIYRQEVFGISSDINFSSYDLLEMILEKADKIVEMDNDSSVSAKVVNYYKSCVKCAIFKKFSNFENFDFAAINYFGDNEKYDYSKQKMLFIPSNELVTPYFLMGIKQSDEEAIKGIYFVNSLVAPQNYINFFDNQEVIIPTQILISDNNNLKKINATADEKLRLLSLYKNIINQFSLPNKMNISGDYEVMLNEFTKVKKYK